MIEPFRFAIIASFFKDLFYQKICLLLQGPWRRLPRARARQPLHGCGSAGRQRWRRGGPAHPTAAARRVRLSPATGAAIL